MITDLTHDMRFANETEFVTHLLKVLEAAGWKAYHVFNTRNRARVSSKGFPDIVAVHEKWGGIAWECKMPGNKATADQVKWLMLFDGVGFATQVIFPSDLDALYEVIERVP